MGLTMTSEAEEINVAELLNTLSNQEKDIGVRNLMAERLGDLLEDQVQPVVAGLPSVLDELLERRHKTRELRVLGKIFVSLGKLCFIFPEKDQVKSLLKSKLKPISTDEFALLEHILHALKRAAPAYPELVLDLRDKIKGILSLSGHLPLKELALEVLTFASWNSAYLIREFIPEIEEMIKQGREADRNIALQTIYRVSRKNYYVVESLIKDLVPESAEEADKETLFLLSNVEIPPDERDLIERIFALNERILLEAQDPDAVAKAANGLAKLVEDEELSELQEKHAQNLRLKIEESANDEEKAELISTTSIPNWADAAIVDSLISLCVKVLTSGVEAKEVKISAAEALHANLLVFHEFGGVILDGFVEVLETGWEEEIKLTIIEILTSTPTLDKNEKETVIESLIKFVEREEEGMLARMAAAEALSDFASQDPRVVSQFGNELFEAFDSSTITDVKRSLVEGAGTLLKNMEVKGENPFLTILVEALDDRELYTTSIEHLNSVAYRTPASLIGYTKALFEFYETLSAMEREEAEHLQRGARVSYFERPKRLFIRILVALLNVHSEIIEDAVNIFTLTLKNSKSENLIREAAYALNDAYDVNPAVVEESIRDQEVPKEKAEMFRELTM